MPGYLYQEQFVPTPVYNSPLDLYGQALQVKDAKFKAGLANIRSRYDNVLNADVTNPENEQAIRTGVQQAMNKLSTVATGDLSIPENQQQVGQLFDNILNDNDIIYDMGWTRGLKNEIGKAEQMQRTKPELVPDQNVEPLYAAQQQYRNSSKAARPGLPKFTPYYDFNAKHNLDLDKIKSDVDATFAQSGDIKVIMPDGTPVDLGSIQDQHLVESIKASKINQLMWDKISSDPQALHQMQLDYSYNKNHGSFTPEAAIEGIDNELATYKSITTGINGQLSHGNLSAGDREQYTKQLNYYNTEVSRLSGLKGKISSGGDPGDYFTFGKTIKNYVESKSLQYSHTKEGLWSAMPGYDIYLKGKFDLLQESMKAKAAKKLAEEIPVETPVVDLVNSLIENPNGIKADDRDVAALGELDKNGNYNLSFDNSDPNTRAIIVPANVNLSQPQMKDVKTGTTLNSFNNEIESLNINSLNQSTDPNAYASPGGFTINTHPAGANEILNTYSANKLAYGDEAAKKIQAVIDRYTPQLKAAGVDPLDVSSRNQAMSKIQDPALKAAIEAGQDLYNLHFKGNFQFLSDADNNLVRGQDDAKMYMKGRLLIPGTQLAAGFHGRTINDLVDAGIFTRESVMKTIGENGKTAQEQMYGMHVYLPVNGKGEDINDRMLGTRGLYSGNSKEDYLLRSKSKQNAIGFSNDVRKANEEGYNFQTQFDADGKPIRPTSHNMIGEGVVTYDTEEMQSLKGLAGNISLSTGQDSDAVLSSIYNIIQSNTNKQTGVRNPVKIYEQIGALSQGVANLSPDTGSFMKGIAGPEGAGYSVGNSESSAFGKYQITEATYEKIKELPSFPGAYKLDSFDDYKKNPQLQEIAMATYSDYLLKKFGNMMAAAVAFYTGEGSPETQAFSANPNKALQQYKDQKPSSGGDNTNMTIGAYLSAFLKNAR